MAEQEITGRCFCGAIRYRVRPPIGFCAHCHCSMCRRTHGAAYTTWVAVPRAQFELLAGGDRLVRFHSSEQGTRSFCSTCGSRLFCDNTQHPDVIDIVLANFDTPVDCAPQAHIYFDDRAPWASVDDKLPRLGGATGLEPLK